MVRMPVYFLCLIFFVSCVRSGGKTDKNSPVLKEELKNVQLSSCKLCRVLVDSFKKGMERTAKSNFQGGDTAWEEEKLGNYASSEVRLTEIQEKLCNDVDRGNSQCHSFAEQVEMKLEDWWFNHQKDNPDLFNWLCIRSLTYCCPLHHFGPLCSPCPGYPNSVCSGNGRCRGSGSRKGNGTCDCDKGYTGIDCRSCADSYYESYRDESKLLCSKCHVACHGSCTQAGPRGCLDCNNGWFFETERGCIDINECVSDLKSCAENEFCVNNEGSFSCLSCDKACSGCHGDGPDMCDNCADDHALIDGMCIKKSADWQARSDDIRRYVTYLGLCLATCIIFQKNPVVASLIGLSVALYVAVSEYMLGVGSSNGNPLFKF